MSTTGTTSASDVTPDLAGGPSSPRGAGSRRVQRSTRLTVATLLVVASALVVVAAVATGSWLVLVAAAALSVVLGLAAVRITWAEVRATRREHQRDRAEQAQAYRRLAEERAAEHGRRVTVLQEQIAEREKALAELGEELGGTQAKVAQGVRTLGVEKRRYEELQRVHRGVERDLEASERLRVLAETGRDDAEGRAAEAIVRLAEIEGEVDTLRAELVTVTAAWRAAEAAGRRHA
ncbi:hypothetical protein [Nocardioides sp. GY 10127]|uniref:hypothetical protein n=1 Tax=Nocardioides sp. GY 10127 TaxID=2569762 RepID=UPI0010A80188|nr:hypothetical protein [Nocardioides sp. GY 10127]TIC79391.1 hypothetical protein E8D37_17560 [Nocardioides sp. GY 10127]